eukprot:CCRYP_006487-RA/>CCRYP_006487-RA protein AED:0.19 eAED:0.19 QI:0/-1/0/1/-1/1/1/0/354
MSSSSSGSSSDESDSSSDESDSSSSIHTESTTDSDASNTSTTTDSNSESSPHEKLIPAPPPTTTTHQNHIDNPYVMETKKWTIQIPIGLGLCPWAIQSHHRSQLQIITSPGITPHDTAHIIQKEMHSLTNSRHDKERVPLRTILVVCPNVNEWKDDFPRFEAFVKSGIEQHLLPSTTNHDIFHDVTLVAFHPKFDRWHALPEDVGVGSVIHSHWSDGGKKSRETAEAVIVEMGNRAFGMRRVKVRFEQDGIDRRREEYVPNDWIVLPQTQSQQQQQQVEQRGSNPLLSRLLPDNVMYRSPYPTIHIIDNRDLASLCVADVSRVKRLNARRMMRLGWDVLEKHLEKMKLHDNGGS